MAEHWTVTHDPPTFCYSVCNGDELIADLFYADGVPEDQEAQRLKAHTVAAAPALLEALAKLVARMEDTPEYSRVFGTDDYTTARAALALARGEAQP